jgi:hypothetical protein
MPDGPTTFDGGGDDDGGRDEHATNVTSAMTRAALDGKPAGFIIAALYLRGFSTPAGYSKDSVLAGI